MKTNECLVDRVPVIVVGLTVIGLLVTGIRIQACPAR